MNRKQWLILLGIATVALTIDGQVGFAFDKRWNITSASFEDSLGELDAAGEDFQSEDECSDHAELAE
jgi:hypothetical protein